MTKTTEVDHKTKLAQAKHDFEVDVYRIENLFTTGMCTKSRSLSLSGPIDESSFPAFDVRMTELENRSHDPITIRINSPGGSVYDALAIVGRLVASPCKVTTIGLGQVMSAATLILACGNTRLMSKYCMFMAHQSSYNIGGSHADVKDEVEQMEREEKLWANWMQDMSSKTKKFWLTKTHKRNMYLTAEECLKIGVIDSII